MVARSSSWLLGTNSGRRRMILAALLRNARAPTTFFGFLLRFGSANVVVLRLEIVDPASICSWLVSSLYAYLMTYVRYNASALPWQHLGNHFMCFRRVRRPSFVFFLAGLSTCFLYRWRTNLSVFWLLLLSSCDDGGKFFCWGLKKRRSWRLNIFEITSYSQESEFPRCEISTPTWIRQVRNLRNSWSRQWFMQSVCSSFFLLCKHLFSSSGVLRKPNVDLSEHFRAHVIGCPLVSLASCFFSSWRRRLILVTVAATATKNQYLWASVNLRFLFFLKKGSLSWQGQ